MKKRPEFKADLAVFVIILFLLGIAFSMFVIEKDPEARLGLFGISIWILVIVGALFWRKRMAPKDPPNDSKHRR